MEAVFEFFLQMVLEMVGQILLQVLAELGWHSMAQVFRREPVPWLAAIGYVLFGVVTGALSVLVLPALIAGFPARVANLVIAPVLAGLAMAAIGAWRRRRGQRRVLLDRFRYGYLFALSMALVRFYLARPAA